VYISDKAGKENVAIMNRLAGPDGRLYQVDDIGRVPASLILKDPGVEDVPLELTATITRPGLNAAVAAGFNVNKEATSLRGELRWEDLPTVRLPDGRLPTRLAVYSRQTGKVAVLDRDHPSLPYELGEFGAELFSVVPADDGFAPFGLTDKYLSPATVQKVHVSASGWDVDLKQGGEFAAWVQKPPAEIRVDGRKLGPGEFTWEQGLLQISAAAMGSVESSHYVRVKC